MFRILILLITLLFCISEGTGQVDIYGQLQKDLESARESNSYEQLALTYYKLALHEEEANRNLEDSFLNLSRSLEYYDLLKDTIGINSCKYHIARQLLQNGMLEDAHDRLVELKDYYIESGDKEKQAVVEMQLFDYHFEKLDIDEAQNTMTTVKALLKEIGGNVLELDFISREIAYNELMQENGLALKNANKCYERSLLSKNTQDLSKCLLSRGRILSKQKAYYAANQDLREGLLHLSEIPFSKERLLAYDLLSRNYKAMDDLNLAYEYGRKYSLLQDSILNENRVLAINNLTYKYESKEKASEIRLLEKDKAFAVQSNQQQKRALIVLGLALGGLILGIYYIIRFYSEKINSAQIIEEQKEKINNQKITELQDRIQINSMQSMIAGQEVERERIAKDLHDSLGGLLSTIKLQIDHIQDKESDLEKLPEFKHTTDLIDVAVSEIRTISQDLQPGALKRLGLVPAINDLVNRYQTKNGPEITFQHFGLPKEMEQGFALSIYRIVQEILNNALKHAKASEIFVQLNKEDEYIVIHIEDDGIGFNPEKKYKSMGLENIKSRVNYHKGTIDIDSRKDKGTSFIIHLNSNFAKEKKG